MLFKKINEKIAKQINKFLFVFVMFALAFAYRIDIKILLPFFIHLGQANIMGSNYVFHPAGWQSPLARKQHNHHVHNDNDSFG